jgi:hypothetical protein
MANFSVSISDPRVHHKTEDDNDNNDKDDDDDDDDDDISVIKIIRYTCPCA